MRKIITLSAAFFLCLLMAGWTISAQRRVQTRWEYKVAPLTDDNTLGLELNLRGADGWELVGFQEGVHIEESGAVRLYYFKRKK